MPATRLNTKDAEDAKKINSRKINKINSCDRLLVRLAGCNKIISVKIRGN
jgi:hypothetical protein